MFSEEKEFSENFSFLKKLLRGVVKIEDRVILETFLK